jgi:hypothetical protein
LIDPKAKAIALVIGRNGALLWIKCASNPGANVLGGGLESLDWRAATYTNRFFLEFGSNAK